MLLRSITFCVIVNLITGGALHAQTVDLTEAPLRGACVRNELTLALEGKFTIKQGGKDVVFPQKVQAAHVFLERFIDVNGAVSDKAARVYTTAESTITFNNDAGPKRTLRPERRFMVAQRWKDHVVSFSPNGTLTRDEQELTEHFDTQSLPGLLAGKEVAVGKSWGIANSVVASICDFDGLIQNKFEGKLEAVKDNIAYVAITGSAEGINLGAKVNVLVNARLEFDVQKQRIIGMEWKEVDQRIQGPVTPALSAEVTIMLKRTPIAAPDDLNDIALVKVPNGPPPSELTAIQHQDAKKRYSLNYGREWTVTSDSESYLVLRYLDRGQFVGQATIVAWRKIDPKNVMKLGDFADEMRKTPGWTEIEEIERKELQGGPKGQGTVYRVAAVGDLDGVRTTQSFYLIVGTNGDQAVVTFSLDPQQVQRLGARDLELIRALEFPEK